MSKVIKSIKLSNKKLKGLQDYIAVLNFGTCHQCGITLKTRKESGFCSKCDGTNFICLECGGTFKIKKNNKKDYGYICDRCEL